MKHTSSIFSFHVLITVLCFLLVKGKSFGTSQVRINQEVDPIDFNFEKLAQLEIGTSINLNTSSGDNMSYINKFDQGFDVRQKKLKSKKEVIINRVFDKTPLIGEVLGIANSQDNFKYAIVAFSRRESGLLKKYIIMYDSKCEYVDEAAELLLNLILCNNDENHVRYLLNEMLEGLCLSDDKSIKIFNEIVMTILIDSIFKHKVFTNKELLAKYNLLKMFNIEFRFRSIEKIRFIQQMLMMDVIKEKLMFIIYLNDSNEKSND